METKLHTLPNSNLQYEHYVPARQISPYPILLVHGMFGGSWQFFLAIEHLLRHGFEVYALNLDGHAPGQTVGSSSLNDYVNDTIAMLWHISRPTILVGHSMGGLIAQIVAESLSEKREEEKSDPLVKAAVFMSSVVPGKRVFVLQMLHPRYILAMIKEKPFHIIPKHVCALHMNRTPHREQYLSRLQPGSGLALKELVAASTKVDARDVACPTLVIGAEHDIITPTCTQFGLAERYHSTYRYTYGGDHMTFMWSVEPMEHIIRWIQSQELYYVEMQLEPGDLCLKIPQ